MSRLQSQVRIRWLIARDMPEVLAIERGSFDCPMALAELDRWRRESNCIGMVAELGVAVAGFMLYAFREDRIVLIDLAVHPDSRRQGLGRVLVDKLIDKLSGRHRRIVVVLRETNLGAQLFFRTMGFRGEEILHEHFVDTGEDGYRFVYRKDKTEGGAC